MNLDPHISLFLFHATRLRLLELETWPLHEEEGCLLKVYRALFKVYIDIHSSRLSMSSHSE